MLVRRVMTFRTCLSALLFSCLVPLAAACSGGGSSNGPVLAENGPDGNESPGSKTAQGSPPADGTQSSDGTTLPPPNGSPPPSSGTLPAPSGIDAALAVPALGATSSTMLVLSQLQKDFSPDVGSCPTVLVSPQRPYVFVEVRNTSDQNALVSIWASTGTTGTSTTIDTMAIYAGNTRPTALYDCVGAVVASCSASPCTGYPGYASSAGNAVEVPAGKSTIVYAGGEPGTTGTFTLNVRSELFF